MRAEIVFTKLCKVLIYTSGSFYERKEVKKVAICLSSEIRCLPDVRFSCCWNKNILC